MKRFLFWFVAALFAIAWLLSAIHDDRSGPARNPEWVRTSGVAGGPPGDVIQQYSGHTVVLYRGAPTDADDLEGFRHEVAGQGGKVLDVNERGVTVLYEDRSADDEGIRFLPDRPPAAGRVHAEGLPVPVVPGTRVTEARVEPPARPDRSVRPRDVYRSVRPRVEPSPPRTRPAEPGLKEVEGRLSATEDRARRDARQRLDREVADLIAPSAARDWKVPAALVDRLIRRVTVKPVVRDYGTLYQATLTVDLSPARLREIVEAHRHEQVVKRLVWLGSLLAFVLVCLATVSGYIKADEATKGYYTTRLRLAAAAGVGAAGVLIYQMMV